jgi:hypothetical protein
MAIQRRVLYGRQLGYPEDPTPFGALYSSCADPF